MTFVGLAGMAQFFDKWAQACGALGQPLPVELWRNTPQIELMDDGAIRDFTEACAANQMSPAARLQYESLVAGWLGTGTSAERDSAILTTTALKLGFKGESA